MGKIFSDFHVSRSGGAGNGNRYANDLSGNHIDMLRKTSTGLGVFLGFANRLCSVCKRKTPTKGGTALGKKFWACADCKCK